MTVVTVRILCAFCLLGALCVEAAEHPLPAAQQSLVGELRERRISAEETFAAVARTEGVGLALLARLNPEIDPWLPQDGSLLQLPTAYIVPNAQREGVVINLSERRLYFFDRGIGKLMVFPVGIGREHAPTPRLTTHTVAKIEYPSWTPTERIRAEHAERGDPLPRVVPPGPDNPLGRYAIQLAASKIFIHGTNRPIGVGGEVSHGCIRLYEPHIEQLVGQLPNGTAVRIVEQPYKAALDNGVVYLEAHPLQIENRDYSGALRALMRLSLPPETAIDWRRAVDVARAAEGIPRVVSTARRSI